jgi:hypothetical protein
VTYSPPSSGTPDWPVLSVMTDDNMIGCQLFAVGTASSSTWPTANTALFFPVRLSQARTYVKAWWLNGATAAGNVDVGIYTIAGTTATRVVASTAVAQAGVSAMQVAGTFTTTTIGPGLYYLAMACSLATATVWRAPIQVQFPARAAGCYQAATAHPLPASITVVAFTNNLIPVFGFSENANV